MQNRRWGACFICHVMFLERRACNRVDMRKSEIEGGDYELVLRAGDCMTFARLVAFA